MSARPDTPKPAQRSAPLQFDAAGKPVHAWTLTHSRINDVVRLNLPPDKVLPVIFVPGIMGSNLRSTAVSNGTGNPVWRLDMGDVLTAVPTKALLKKVFHDAGTRQRELHPSRTAVDDRGNTPKRLAGMVHRLEDYRERFWGEVGEGSYHEFLLWLEDALNGIGYNPALWPQFSHVAVSATPKPGERAPEPRLFPGITMDMHGLPTTVERGTVPDPILSDELLARARFRMPVFAFGYNWLQSNQDSAVNLRKRIEQVMSLCGGGCTQVILVTHSMGGLVARHCQQLPGMATKIAGVVHGVMPAEGAAVAYRRCKLGMADEVSGVGKIAALIIGNNGRETTAVFAQAPGALQLLPTPRYRGEWLRICDENGHRLAAYPIRDPYSEVYLRTDRWWGLIRSEWLAPAGGIPLKWETFVENVNNSRAFHNRIQDSYHPNTFVYYGCDPHHASFEHVEWRVCTPSTAYAGSSYPIGELPRPMQVANMGFDKVHDVGRNPLMLGGQPRLQDVKPYASHVPTAPVQWHLRCQLQNGAGDGTVPASSGRAPLLRDQRDHVRQQFRLAGFDHEASYKNDGAQLVTLYSIIKIAAIAKTAA